jgi:UDPglucose--hexose-1-phosphate uridylyltransferase
MHPLSGNQIWASSFLPNEARKEDEQQRLYYQKNGRPLLQDYVQHELQVEGDDSRVVIQNEEWVAIVPYWACWPFETILLPKHVFHTLPELSDTSKRGLAQILKSLTTVYDNLFHTSFPYSMGVHGM